MKILVLGGPTASGKSDLAHTLALELRKKNIRVGIFCADSITVYRGLDIGSAKPTAGQRAEAPYYLLDILEPHREFNANDFLERMDSELNQANLGVAIVVGGSGFYLRAFLRGTAATTEDKEKSADVKQRLLSEANVFGYANLYKKLVTLDPGSARTVHENDHYRIIRALQAMEISGRKWSELNQEARSRPPRFKEWAYFSLLPSREALQQNIETRTKKMLANGLLNEVRGLISAGLDYQAKSLQSVGYKQAVEVLRGEANEANLAAAICLATTQLAKRQSTWFRGEELATIVQDSESLRGQAMSFALSSS
jgi:tRNA dimethylallyltransferase